VGKEALRAGKNILDDVTLGGRPVKEAAKERIRESGKNLKRKADVVLDKLLLGESNAKEGEESEYKKKNETSTQSTSAPGTTNTSAAKRSKSGKVAKKKKKQNMKARVARDIFENLYFKMALLHTESCQSIKSELSLFELPSTQTAIEGSYWVQYKPISSLNDQSPIEFTIPGNTEYLDSAYTMLSVNISVTCTSAE
uniref:hypothetical protein n=1 Tax=Escherichia coli TaxID=562 RepID=UPI0029164D9F